MKLLSGIFLVTVCWSLRVQSSPAISEHLQILHRTRRREPTRREIDVVVEWLRRNLPSMGLELCNLEDPYEGLRCPGTDEVDGLCARWDEICDGEQKCGLRKRELCINALMEEGFIRDVAEDKCSGEESKDMCDIKEKEPPRCGDDYELTEESRSVVITSPEYPNSYPGDLHCFWRIKGPPNSKLTVQFLDFETEANYDYLNVGVGHKCDPVDRENYAIYKHSGNSLPPSSLFTVNNNEVFATFYSDYHDHGKGFRMVVSLANTGSPPPMRVTTPQYNTTCGGKIEVPANGEVVITSPNYPNKYDNLYQCDWFIQLPKGRRMGLIITDFITEKKADILKIGAGRKVDKDILYTFSGNFISDGILLINSSKGWMRFTTDDSNRRRGFRVRILDYPLNDCGGSFEIPRDGSVAVASPLYPFRAYRLNQQCLWQFKISNGRKLSVRITDFSLSSDDILSVGSGDRPAYDWSNYIIKEAPGQSTLRPKKFFTSKNAVWFYFRSNEAGVDRGFKAEVFDSKLYKPKKRPKKGKRVQPNMDCGGSVSREDVFNKITIQSPGYPGVYGSLMECYWFIDVPFGGDIRMKFEFLNTEKHLDTLTIGNGTRPNKKSEVLLYSGFERPEMFEGVFHQMWIRFNSDIKNQYGGFSLTIEPRPYINCGGELQVPPDGSLALGSPNYPDIYPPNAVCRYVVRGPLHHRISVSIAGFETEVDEDTLTVSEGCPVTDPDGKNVVLYKHSGRALPVNYQSLPRSDTIWIEFTSNERIGYHGFLLNFADTSLKAVPVETVGCPAYNRTSPTEFIVNATAD